MAARRSKKRGSEAVEDDCKNGSTKKIKKEVLHDVIWEWEDDGSKWTPYSDDINEEISKSFQAGNDKMHFTTKGTKFEVIFSRMVQRNAVSCWERRIRTKPDSDADGTWQWENEKGKWSAYEEQTQKLLLAARRFSLKQVEFSVQGKKYVVNLTRMEQANKSTRARRKVRYLESENDEEEASQNDESVTKKVKKEVKISKKEGKSDDDQKEEKEVSPSDESATKKVKKEVKRNRREVKNDEGQIEEKGRIESKSVKKKGKAPVDEECSVKEKYHVYSEKNEVWDAMLNQTSNDVMASVEVPYDMREDGVMATNLRNNNNKFYLMQLLEHDKSKQYAVWFRWGRVGLVGQKNLVPCGSDLLKAKEVFSKKFSDKTKNDWEDREHFSKVEGKYDLLHMDYEANVTASQDDVDGEVKDELKRPDSQLDKRVQALVELICDIKEMEEAVLEMKYDAKKAPLGKLTKEQIKAGYEALKKIDAFIRKKNIADGLVRACNEFYTRIPHVFGMQRPPLIKTREEVKKKLELLEFLGDIEIAMTVIKDNQDMLLDPIDRHYNALECDIEPIEKDEEEYEIIERYLQNTHAKTHNTYKMEVQQIFKLKKDDEVKQFNDCGNRMLLWHGSRLTNYVGILKRGLRVAPPEAPVTGYMFGKGIYFADMSSKSANYCYPSRSRAIGLVMLCEVAIGQPRELLAADYEADQLPDGFHSVKGLGKTAPDARENHTMPDGTVVPLGKPKDTGVKNPDGYTLNYNEFIVYNRNQVKSRYLIQVKFNFT